MFLNLEVVAIRNHKQEKYKIRVCTKKEGVKVKTATPNMQTDKMLNNACNVKRRSESSDFVNVIKHSMLQVYSVYILSVDGWRVILALLRPTTTRKHMHIRSEEVFPAVFSCLLVEIPSWVSAVLSFSPFLLSLSALSLSLKLIHTKDTISIVLLLLVESR